MPPETVGGVYEGQWLPVTPLSPLALESMKLEKRPEWCDGLLGKRGWGKEKFGAKVGRKVGGRDMAQRGGR